MDDDDATGVRINRTNSQEHERLDNQAGLGSPLLSHNNATFGGGRTTSSDEYFEEIEIEIQDGH